MIEIKKAQVRGLGSQKSTGSQLSAHELTINKIFILCNPLSDLLPNRSGTVTGVFDLRTYSHDYRTWTPLPVVGKRGLIAEAPTVKSGLSINHHRGVVRDGSI